MHPAAAGGRTRTSPSSGRAAAAGGPRGMPRKTCTGSGSAGSCSWLHSPGAPGAHADTRRVFSFRGDRHRWVLVLLCSAHYHPTVGSGCSHHPVTMGPIQPLIPEGKSVSRKETKTEKGNSLELSVLRVPRVVAADKGHCLSAPSAARLPQPWVPPRPGVPACPCARRGSGALEAGSRCSPTIPKSKPLALTGACVSRSGRAQRCGSPELCYQHSCLLVPVLPGAPQHRQTRLGVLTGAPRCGAEVATQGWSPQHGQVSTPSAGHCHTALPRRQHTKVTPVQS